MSPATNTVNSNPKIRFQTFGVPYSNISNANKTSHPDCVGRLPSGPTNQCMAPPGRCRHPQCIAPSDCMATTNACNNGSFKIPPQHVRSDRKCQRSSNYMDATTAPECDGLGGKFNCRLLPPLEESGPEDVVLDDNMSSTTSGSYMVDHTEVDESGSKNCPTMTSTMWCAASSKSLCAGAAWSVAIIVIMCNQEIGMCESVNVFPWQC